MKNPAGQWLNALGVPALVCALLTFGTGCGALKAAANPKVAWALNDPAPMSVVVRRADVAEKTSKEVDRLMTETPANDDSPWLAKVAPDKEAAAKDMNDLKTHDLYVAGNMKLVAAEVWAKELAQVEPKNAAPSATPAAPTAAPVAATATPAAKNGSAKATPAQAPEASPSTPADSAAVPSEKEGKEVKGKGKKKGAKTAKNDAAGNGKKKSGKKSAKESKAEKEAAAAAQSEAAPAATTAATTTDAAATPAAAPAAAPAKYTSLLSAIDPSLGTEWAKVMEKKKAMGDAKAQIAVLESANDAKGISDADKKSNKAKIDELEKTVDALEKDANQLAKDFVPKAKAAAQKAAPETREKFGPSLVNLRQAVADADISNSAAAVRYPMAATTLLDSAKQMAKIYVADVIEEKTGKRPSTQGLEPGVTMEGGGVQVTLNGLSTSDMGKLSAGDLTKEVAARTSAWAKRALGLLGVISSTKDVLSFEEDVLNALLDGFKASGYNAPAPATIPEPPPGPAAGQPRA